jgi:hypothetical protein
VVNITKTLIGLDCTYTLAGGREEGMRSDVPRAWEGAVAVNEERETGFLSLLAGSWVTKG